MDAFFLNSFKCPLISKMSYGHLRAVHAVVVVVMLLQKCSKTSYYKSSLITYFVQPCINDFGF